MHPDGTGALKKNGPQAIGKSRGGWTTKIHLVAANARLRPDFALSPDKAAMALRDAIAAGLGSAPASCHLIMDRAYEGNETRQFALELGLSRWCHPTPIASPWEYDRDVRKRNEVERLFRRLKGFRRVFSRFDKLDVMFMAFIHFALIFEALR